MIKQYKFAICDDDIQFCNKIIGIFPSANCENSAAICEAPGTCHT